MTYFFRTEGVQFCESKYRLNNSILITFIQHEILKRKRTFSSQRLVEPARWTSGATRDPRELHFWRTNEASLLKDKRHCVSLWMHPLLPCPEHGGVSVILCCLPPDQIAVPRRADKCGEVRVPWAVSNDGPVPSQFFNNLTCRLEEWTDEVYREQEANLSSSMKYHNGIQ